MNFILLPVNLVYEPQSSIKILIIIRRQTVLKSVKTEFPFVFQILLVILSQWTIFGYWFVILSILCAILGEVVQRADELAKLLEIDRINV